jgi:NADPH:quinone reductase
MVLLVLHPQGASTFRFAAGQTSPPNGGIKIKPMLVSDVLERTEWLELLRNMVAAGEIKLRVVTEYAPEQTADAQRALEAGSLRGRPVILF